MQEYLFEENNLTMFFSLKESNNIMKDPVTIAAESTSGTVNEKSESDEKTNGNHTPV